MDIDFSKIKKVYFVGIGGIGVSAVARMMLHDGKEVRGSDSNASLITEELEKASAKIDIGQSANFIDKDTDIVIYTIAIAEYDKPLLEKITHLGIPAISYPEALEIISKDKFTIAISGTHGKTTTTAMIAHAMISTGLDPTVIVGSMMLDTNPSTSSGQASNFIAGKSKYFVAEACEYRRSFLHLNPKILVITNIDADHLDYYKGISDIENAFGELAEKVPEDGFLVCNARDERLASVIARCKGKVIDYTLNDTPVDISFPGKHNQQNADAALAVLSALGIKESDARKALETFAGTWRRFEYKGMLPNGALVYDDYAHHPNEIRALIEGVKEEYSGLRIVTIFQPHLYSRTKSLFADFTKAFAGVDEALFAPIYPAREEFDPSISSKMLADAVVKEGIPAQSFESFQAIVDYLKQTATSRDIIITVGAGDIFQVGDMLLNGKKN